MTSIRPSMPNIPQTSPLQNTQRAQPQPQAEAAKAPPPPKETPAAKDENKTQTFDDTPMADVALTFEGDAKAAEATAEIEGLFEAEASEETEEADAADEGADVEAEGEVDQAEAEALETEESEDEEGGTDESGDFDEGNGNAEAEIKVQVAPLLELLPQLRELSRFRVEETWAAYGG